QAVASEFIASGNGRNVLIEKTRTSQSVVPVLPNGVATTTPLVILVDGDTASAAEITTGAIHVNRPDVRVVGQTTFGTGTVLQSYMLSDGSALILGTQEFLLPNGASIYGKGYTPDTPVALPTNAAPLTPLVAAESSVGQQQLIKSHDTQLLTAIGILAPNSAYVKAAA
ncbi:MAG TPA: S41 family peptidase, partial [Ktedonobacterales bacterium]